MQGMEVECPRCNGMGEIKDPSLVAEWRRCPRCGGTGTVEKVPKY